MSRLDLFLVYGGNGVDNIQDILSIIRKYFKILMIKQFDITKLVNDESLSSLQVMQKFIDSVYTCDHVPLEHLVGKTQYLLKLPQTVVVIVVKNSDPDEKIFGEGEFSHIQCGKIKECKEEIRSRFNPKIPSKDNNGRPVKIKSEEHVVHSTDYEDQTKYLLKYFGLPTIGHFNRVPNEKVNAPYYITPFEKFEIRTVDIDQIKIKLIGTEETSIAETPHYAWLSGEKKAYREYTSSLVGSEDFSDHCETNFLELMNNFDYRPENYVLVTIRNGEYWCPDGIHRLAILKWLGSKEVSVIVTTQQFTNKIDFSWWLQEISSVPYVLLRLKNHWPLYTVGEDLDILTSERDKILWATIRFGILCKTSKVVIGQTGDHTHVDFYFDNEEMLHYRFDILTSLSEYNATDSYQHLVQFHHIVQEHGKTFYKIPPAIDNLVLRLMEYLTHREKTQHLEYVLEHIDENLVELCETLQKNFGVEITKKDLVMFRQK